MSNVPITRKRDDLNEKTVHEAHALRLQFPTLLLLFYYIFILFYYIMLLSFTLSALDQIFARYLAHAKNHREFSSRQPFYPLSYSTNNKVSAEFVIVQHWFDYLLGPELIKH